METGSRNKGSFVCVCMDYTACPAVLLVTLIKKLRRF